MSNRVANDIVSRITDALQKGRAIGYCQESPDNDYPEVKSQMFGLIDTNEVAVTAKCGNVRIGLSEESWLSYPSMADRIFGIDVADQELAAKLADDLWKTNSTHFVEAAEYVRSQRRT